MNHLRHFLQTPSHLRAGAVLRRTALLPAQRPNSHVNSRFNHHRQFNTQPDKQSTYSLHPQKTSKCPKCGQPLPTRLPTCTNPQCGHIEPISTDLKKDYFALFGLPGITGQNSPSSSGSTGPVGQDSPNGENEEGMISRNAFSLDPKLLRRRFLQMQKVCHPDVWTKRGPEAATLADAQSAQINKAYQTLLSPRLRGEYILALHGIDIGEADNMEDEQELAMEVMEAREELENAEGEEVRTLMKSNDERLEAATADLENSIGAENWEEAKRAVIRLRYWESFERAAKGLEVDH